MTRYLTSIVFALSACAAAMGAEPATRPTSASAPAKLVIDQSSPKALLLSAHQAATANDRDALVQLTDPAMKTIMEAAMDIQRTVGHLFGVMDAKLGKAGDEFKKRAVFFGGDVGLISPLAPAVVNGKVDWSKVKIDEKDDWAGIMIGGVAGIAKKIDGKWYWVGEQELGKEDLKQATIGTLRTLGVVQVICRGLEKGLSDGTVTKDNFEATLDKLLRETASTGVDGN